ncbi:unnamed protein product [Symbiodinium sp. KB8]|nr:unnamed protein product [Symbiodinium sp. KB8]
MDRVSVHGGRTEVPRAIAGLEQVEVLWVLQFAGLELVPKCWHRRLLGVCGE